jgi:hypothetical protein
LLLFGEKARPLVPILIFDFCRPVDCSAHWQDSSKGNRCVNLGPLVCIRLD